MLRTLRFPFSRLSLHGDASLNSCKPCCVVHRRARYGGDTPAERLAARKLVSRDVRAIEHLHGRGVLPSAVQDLGRTPGEGLHAWAGRRAAPRKALANAERRERALVHSVEVTTRRPDGSRKGRHRFTGVCRAEFEPLLRRLQALGTQSTRAS